MKSMTVVDKVSWYSSRQKFFLDTFSLSERSLSTKFELNWNTDVTGTTTERSAFEFFC